MPLRNNFTSLGVIILMLSMISAAQQSPNIADAGPSVVQESLTQPGSVPFHLKAIVTEKGDPSPTYVEMFWESSLKWRRDIKSEDFSQTLIVNGEKVSEQDSDQYFPVGLQTLVNAMVDPATALSSYRPGDTHLTVHSISFTDYQSFKGKRIARGLFTNLGPGASMSAEVTKLEELRNPDDRLFAVDQTTAKEKQIRVVTLPEVEFRALALESHEIIWPQVLDGATTGTARIYVAIDPSGTVREALPVYTDNERANESACRQIKTWKFKPAMKDGAPVQAESVLTFAMNTRAWGPAFPLSDTEVRKLASNTIDPVFPAGTAPEATCSLHVAIDFEGHMIESIAGEGTPGLSGICYQAVTKWHFSPIIENGEPRPYRAEIRFSIPKQGQ
jgi:hypothetical protein